MLLSAKKADLNATNGLAGRSSSARGKSAGMQEPDRPFSYLVNNRTTVFYFLHACMHGEPLQHSLFELAVDGQHLRVADKGEGQDGDGVGRLWEVIGKDKSVRKQLPTDFLSLKPHSSAGKHRRP